MLLQTTEFWVVFYAHYCDSSWVSTCIWSLVKRNGFVSRPQALPRNGAFKSIILKEVF